MHLKSIHIYPLKSCAGLELPETEVDQFGPKWDRRWMLVDKHGKFLSQRAVPRMARLRMRVDGERFQVGVGSRWFTLEVPVDDEQREVRIWHDHVAAVLSSAELSGCLSEYLSTPCQAVFMPEHAPRLVSSEYAANNERVAFADGFPFLLISQASLDELSARLGRPVEMNRFRPNLVVDGCSAFAEDSWQTFRIGDVQFNRAKPCARCVIPTIDQRSAIKDPEIFRELSAFRRDKSGQVMFGQNLIHLNMGKLVQGAPLVLLD